MIDKSHEAGGKSDADDTDDTGDTNVTDWTSILKEVRQHTGCRIAARATETAESSTKDWVVIGRSHLESTYQASTNKARY